MMTAGIRVFTAAAFWAAGLSGAHAVSSTATMEPGASCLTTDLGGSVDCLGIFNDGLGRTADVQPFKDGIQRVPGDVGDADAATTDAVLFNENLINADTGFGGFTNWQLSAEVNARADEINPTPDGTNQTVGDSATIFLDGVATDDLFTIELVREGTSGINRHEGTWSVTDWNDVQAAAIVMLTAGIEGQQDDYWSIYLLDLTFDGGAWQLLNTFGVPGPTNYPEGPLKEAELASFQLYTVAATSEVPVPAAAPLLVGALGAFGLLRRRRKA